MSDLFFERVAFIGIGHIGSSLVRVMLRDKLAGTITACANRAETLETVKRLKLADAVTTDPAAAVKDADLVVLATPLSAYGVVAKAIAPALKPGAIVTDVGSVKSLVLREVKPLLPVSVHLVPGHPVAGTENSGPESGFPEVFRGRWCILTPVPGGDAAALDKVTRLWQAAEMQVVTMDAEHHDMVLAITSHLPHLIAYTIVGTATDLEETLKSEVIKFSASGFRDFTRIAASSPEMWRDICLANRVALLSELRQYADELYVLIQALEQNDAAKLDEVFTEARKVRANWTPQ